ncbi:unnamed protein product [Leuciscus chuanchicus]
MELLVRQVRLRRCAEQTLALAKKETQEIKSQLGNTLQELDIHTDQTQFVDRQCIMYGRSGCCSRDNEGSCAALGRALAVDAHGWPGGGVGPHGPGTGRCGGDRTSPDQGDPAEAGVHQQAHHHPGRGVRQGAAQAVPEGN